VITRGAPVEPAALGERRVVLASEDTVLGQVVRHHQPSLLPVFGDEGHPAVDVFPTALVGHRFAEVGDRPVGRIVHPRDCLDDELGLTVSVDTGDAEHLACTELEDPPRHRLNAAVVVGVDLGHLKDAVARLLRRRRGLHQHLAADHHLRKILTGHVCGRDRPDVDAVAEDGDLVGRRQRLAELVRDEDDRLPLLGELLEDAVQVLDLLRRQHRGRLVEDEHVGAAVQRLFRISTRCWTPTETSSIRASGSTSKP